MLDFRLATQKEMDDGLAAFNARFSSNILPSPTRSFTLATGTEKKDEILWGQKQENQCVFVFEDHDLTPVVDDKVEPTENFLKLVNKIRAEIQQNAIYGKIVLPDQPEGFFVAPLESIDIKRVASIDSTFEYSVKSLEEATGIAVKDMHCMRVWGPAFDMMYDRVHNQLEFATTHEMPETLITLIEEVRGKELVENPKLREAVQNAFAELRGSLIPAVQHHIPL